MAPQSIWIFGYGSLVWRPNFEYSRKVHGYIKGWRRAWWQGSTDHRGTPERPGRTLTLEEDSTAVTWGAAYELAGTFEQQQETLKYLEWREKQYDIRHYVDLYARPSASYLASDVQSVKSTILVEQQQTCHPEHAAELHCSKHNGYRGSVQQQSKDQEGLHNHNQTNGFISEVVHLQQKLQQQQQQEDGQEQLLVAGCLVYIAGPDKTRNANYLGPATVHEIAKQIATSHGPSGPNCDYLFGLADYMRKMGEHDDELFHLEQLVRTIMADGAAMGVSKLETVATTVLWSEHST